MRKAILILILLLACAVNSQAQTATSFTVSVPTTGTSSVQLLGTVDSGVLTYGTLQSGCGSCLDVPASQGALSQFNSSTGVLLFTPVAGFTGQTTFTYVAKKDGTPSAQATVTINVSSAKTVVTGPFPTAGGLSPGFNGTVMFALTSRATVTDGLIPAIATVSATVTSGNFSVSLYPSTTMVTSSSGANSTSLTNSLGSKSYYQVWVKSGNRQESLGIYDIPASTASVRLADISPVTRTQAEPMLFVSQAAFNAFLGRSYAVGVQNNGTLIGTRGTINLIPGANITYTITDNPGSGRVDVQIDGPAGGGGGGAVLTGTVGRLAKYNTTTAVDALTLGSVYQPIRVNATTNGYEHYTPTAGTGISISNSAGVQTIANTGITSINGASGAHVIGIGLGVCGTSPDVTVSGSTTTVCVPSASLTATGTMTAIGTPQNIAGSKIFTGFDNDDTPVIVRKKSGGSDTLQLWQTPGGSTTTSEHTIYGGWHRLLNVGLGTVAPLSAANNNAYLVEIGQNSTTVGSDPLNGVLINQEFSGAGATSADFKGLTTLLNINGTGNRTGTQIAAAYISLGVGGTDTTTAGVATRSGVSKSGAGTLSTGYGYLGESTISAGIVTTLPYIYLKAPTVTGGSITNLRGIEIEDFTVGTSTNIAIKTGRGDVSFGDNVIIRGISAPAVSAADSGKFYYDSTADKLKLSENGGAFGFVANYLEGSATLDFSSVSANSCSTHGTTITVTGATDGKPVWLGYTNAAYSSGITYSARVSASNTVSVTACNSTGGAVDPASGTFTVRVGQ